VFGIQIEGCARCGGRRKIIASIEEPEAIAKTLSSKSSPVIDLWSASLDLLRCDFRHRAD